MKSILVALALIAGITVTAQDKTQSFTVERTLNVPADAVWKIVGEDFADIAKSHPKLASSHYVDGTPKAGEGCERVCNLSEDGEKYTHEKMVDYDPVNYSFKAEISHVGGLPLDASQSYMLYDVDAIDESSSRLTLHMVYLTDPAFMGGMVKGKFRKNISDYAIAIQHHALTGEDVNPDNFKDIKKKYKKQS